MSQSCTPAPHDFLSEARWRKSSYSGGANDCVEIAELGTRYVVVRDSKEPGMRPLVFERAAVCALVTAV
ncbi:DUF397 domain-containing protein [Streptomyces apocyni]|uniref:DUF397 domain-containing protein n=1 Tax=Streptomyces apocyni TaxID=2654677 RepID=UPI0012EA0C64|nr:DUF397 domain-containing protein [Streptomyces apocyni]